MKNEIEQLNALLDNLKISRNDAEFYKAEKKSMLELVTTREDYLLASVKQEESELIVAGLETQIRTMALQLNEVMADLPDRVSVKMFSIVQISDEQKAKEWCIDHFTPALKLDAKTFEKAAKDGNIPADLATVTKEARAQIATKL
jgi:dGTP triphosphohydrolase